MSTATTVTTKCEEHEEGFSYLRPSPSSPSPSREVVNARPSKCDTAFDDEEDDDDDDDFVKQVALTVPTTDDPSLPVLTFCMWVLGILSCVTLSLLNQFFFYRT